MKKIRILLPALLTFMTLSCSKPEEPGRTPGSSRTDPEEETPEFTGDGYLRLKAVLGPFSKVDTFADGKTRWETGDMISVYNGTSFRDFLLESGAGTDEAVFKGLLDSAATYWALYPASAVANDWKMSGGAPLGYFRVPSEQTALRDRVALDAMSAVYLDGSLVFSHASSALRLTVTPSSPDIVSVSLTSDAVLWGKYSVNPNTLKQSLINGTGNSGNSVILRSPDGKPFEAGDYYFAVAAKTLCETGLELEFTRADGVTAKKTVEGRLTAASGVAYDLGTVSGLNFGHVYSIGEPYPSSGIPEGIVVGVSGATVTLLSLDEKPAGAWSADTGTTSAQSTTDGKANTVTITALPDYSEANYPAVYYCASKGNGWYLAGYKEFGTVLLDCNLLSDSGVAAFNAKLAAIGGTPLNSSAASARYWSSTESPGATTKVYTAYVHSSGTSTTGYATSKTTKTPVVRCLRTISLE